MECSGVAFWGGCKAQPKIKGGEKLRGDFKARLIMHHVDCIGCLKLIIATYREGCDGTVGKTGRRGGGCEGGGGKERDGIKGERGVIGGEGKGGEYRNGGIRDNGGRARQIGIKGGIFTIRTVCSTLLLRGGEVLLVFIKQAFEDIGIELPCPFRNEFLLEVRCTIGVREPRPECLRKRPMPNNIILERNGLFEFPHAVRS